jgi:hypothetical protein
MKGGAMYSPKVREDLIPRIYRAAKAAGVPMTRWVNEAVVTALATPPQLGGEDPEPMGNPEAVSLHASSVKGGPRS